MSHTSKTMMRPKAIIMSFLFMLLSSVGIVAAGSGPTADAAANWCNRQYPVSEDGSVVVNERNSSLRAACKTGYNTKKCGSIKAIPPYTTKAERKTACQKGVTQRQKDDRNGGGGDNDGGGNFPSGGGSISASSVGIPQVDADSVVQGVLNTVYFIAGAASIIIIIIGGILYATSEGDPSKVKRAKDTILYAVVGLVVVMMAFVITGFVIGRF